MSSSPSHQQTTWDLVIVAATPGGITAAIAAARAGASVLLLERTAHPGGLCANGLAATDIATRGATGGLFLEFVSHIRDHYLQTYGPNSEQFDACSDGYHFEPSVAERVFHQMLDEHRSNITVLTMRQFDALPENVERSGAQVTAVTVLNRTTGQTETYRGRMFIDATYEGDLAAAAGAPFRTRRESVDEYHEPRAGKVYTAWHTGVLDGSTGEGDDTIQSYNYRLCLTDRPDNRVPITQPPGYNRNEYVSLIDDIRNNVFSGKITGEFEVHGIGRITNIVITPNGKTDANNQHLALISTDLPEENYPWPTADWAWRDAFADRLRNYILGLFYFAQNDPELPAEFRAACSRWGLARDEYTDNGYFPRQVYVREGRRIEGQYLFTGVDALPVEPHGRPRIFPTSITASHYALDSHAVRKREPGRLGLDGFFSYPTKPYTVPLGVMLPRELDNVLTPVPASSTHIGFSTLRMEPCWMALGQAAGACAVMAMRQGTLPHLVDIGQLQRRLIDEGAVLIYYRDAEPSDPAFKALQYFGVRGAVPQWQARLDEPVDAADLQQWKPLADGAIDDVQPGSATRGQVLQQMYHQVCRTSQAVTAASR